MTQGQETPAHAGTPEISADARAAGGLVWYRYANAAAMMEELADTIADSLAQAVGERRQASLVLPGGATPRP
ncbi:MAG: hypothetical protein D6757_08770, partial [Alphaproteobacteria bacterium]